jgi:hypothetical protein
MGRVLLCEPNRPDDRADPLLFDRRKDAASARVELREAPEYFPDEKDGVPGEDAVVAAPFPADEGLERPPPAEPVAPAAVEVALDTADDAAETVSLTVVAAESAVASATPATGSVVVWTVFVTVVVVVVTVVVAVDVVFEVVFVTVSCKPGPA